MKKKIGLDLDGVLYDFYTPTKEYFLEKGYKATTSNTYYLYEIFGISWAEALRLTKEFGEENRIFRTLPIVPEIREFVDKIHDDCEIHIITSRSWYDGAEEDTLYRLDKDKIPYEDLFFTPFGDMKGEIAKKKNLDCFVEDSPNQSKSIADEAGIPVYLVDWDFNKGFEYPGVKRVDKSEVFCYIKRDIL